MGKYIRLLRLQDQYIQFGSAISAGIYLRVHDWNIFYWAIATTFLSFCAFIVNEITDRKDSDKYSWNPIHVRSDEPLDMRIVWCMFVVFTVSGLFLSWILRYFWWGVALYSIGVLYSLEPIRLKRRFALDILGQMFVWWILPFLAPVWGRVNINSLTVFLIVMGSLIWSAFYPYQIADYQADKKAGFHNTHVVLGVRGSAWFGMILGVVGMLLFVVLGIYRIWRWAAVIAIVDPIVVVLYIKWIRMHSVTGIVKSMQKYSSCAKTISILIPLYLLVVWRFF